MAYNPIKIDPLDLQPRKAIGVNLPFTGKAVFNSTYTSKEAIKANLLNFFLTGVGERYLNPGFGSSLRNLLFENIDQTKLQAIRSNIENQLELYFPRIIPTEVDLIGNPDENLVSFVLKYQVRDTNIDDDILINIEQ